ncbi:MAG: S24 family peptidase [Lautropia sp.]|nr:S24 family peptidase [Lautropia sp.]
MDFRERLIEAIRISGKTRVEIAKETGISPVAITNWLSGKVKGMRGSTAAKFEQVTGVRASWVITGSGQKLVANTEYEGVSPAAGMRTLPVLADAALLTWKERPDPYANGHSPDGWIMSEAPVSPHTFACRVRDTSMQPACLPGDLVIVDPNAPIAPGAMIAATVGDTAIVIRKYRVRSIAEDGAEVFELIPLNEDYPILRSTNTPTEVLGAIVELRRSFTPPER